MLKWKPTRWLRIALPSGLLLAAGAAFLILHPSVPAKLDLLGMIRSIHDNNDSINQVNGQIVSSMEQISSLSNTTAQIGHSLHGLQTNMQKQDEFLVRLEALSRQEIELSDNLHNLAGQLTGDLRSIKDASETQKSAVQSMLRSAQALGAAAQHTERANAAMAGKLGQAADLTAQVNQSIP